MSNMRRFMLRSTLHEVGFVLRSRLQQLAHQQVECCAPSVHLSSSVLLSALMKNKSSNPRRMFTQFLSYVIFISDLDVPKLTGSDKVTFTINKSLTLQCEVSGHPPPQVFWTDSKGKRHEGALFTKERAGKEDEGTYRCFAKNLLGVKNVSVLATAVGKSYIPVCCPYVPLFVRLARFQLPFEMWWCPFRKYDWHETFLECQRQSITNSQVFYCWAMCNALRVVYMQFSTWMLGSYFKANVYFFVFRATTRTIPISDRVRYNKYRVRGETWARKHWGIQKALRQNQTSG